MEGPQDHVVNRRARASILLGELRGGSTASGRSKLRHATCLLMLQRIVRTRMATRVKRKLGFLLRTMRFLNEMSLGLTPQVQIHL